MYPPNPRLCVADRKTEEREEEEEEEEAGPDHAA